MPLDQLIKNSKMRNLCLQYPIILDANNSKHILIFRRLIEWSMSEGRWSGWMADKS